VNMHIKHQQGVTLIELMISITLGLLVVAAATQMLVSSSRSTSAQQAGSSLLNDEIFGLPVLINSIVSSGYGAKETDTQSAFVLNDETPFGGVVLSAISSAADTSDQNLMAFPASNPANFLTGTGNTASNMTGRADQLTLQRLVDQDTIDCEGSPVAEGQYLVERYFLALDTISQSGEPRALALRCAAGNFAYDFDAGVATWAGTSDFTDNGSIVISRVDHIQVLLGTNESVDLSTRPDTNAVRYYTASDYMGLTVTPKPKITQVKLALVVRSATPTNTQLLDNDPVFELFGEQRTLNNRSASGNYQRELVEKTILLRNARG